MTDFPLSDEHGTTRVPNAVIATLIQDDIDKEIITLVLRVLWWLERSRDYPKSVSVSDLRSDRMLVSKLGNQFERALDATVSTGMFQKNGPGATEKIFLNTESTARLVANSDELPAPAAGGWDDHSTEQAPADAYREYEKNVAPLTPMIREAVSRALQDFTDQQIVEAIRIAVENEARNWSYVSAVLRKWNRGGMPHESSPRRESGEQRLSEGELRRYLERQQ